MKDLSGFTFPGISIAGDKQVFSSLDNRRLRRKIFFFSSLSYSQGMDSNREDSNFRLKVAFLFRY